MTLLAIALAFSGFAALCLAMERHSSDLSGRAAASPGRRGPLRVAGWLLLTLALALCVMARGWGLGPVLWLGALAAAGALLVLGLLPYRPKAIIPLAWGAPPLAAALWWTLG